MRKQLKKSLFVTLLICILFAMSALTVQAAGKTGWVRKGTTYRYKVNNVYVKNNIKKIGKHYYYFDKKGIRRTGWKKYKGKKYYFDKKKAYAYTGKKLINKKIYLFDKNGRQIVKKGLNKYGKSQVYIKSDGSLATGLVKIKGKVYLFEGNGVLTTKNGIHKLNGKTYYVKKGQLVSGWIEIENHKKHFNKSTYCLDTGVVKIDNRYYHFNENGIPVSGICSIKGEKYYYDKTGERKTGFITIGSNQYYFAYDGKMVKDSYIKDSGYTYFADANGRIKKNCWYQDQYFDNQGRVVKDAVTYDSSTTGQLTKAMLDALPLTGCTKLMVVAHPDDETLWGGAHLTEGGWFVVCLTNGYNEIRKNEFYNVIRASGNVGMILSYPDLVNGKRSDWNKEKPQIAKDLDLLMRYKRWGMVATHNPNGEYGHIHHRMTSKLVTQSFNKNYWGTYLYYFGKYYTKRDLPYVQDSLPKMPEANVNKKREMLLSLYPSQRGAVNDSIHMADYENFVRSDKWR